MVLPEQVKVGGQHYKVEQKPFVEINNNKNYLGACDYEHTKIEVLENASEERKEEIFVHELFHAILNEAGFDNHDEELVNRASKVLYQVLKDNDINFNDKKVFIDGIGLETHPNT